MKRFIVTSVIGLAAALTTTAALEREADACGGCFNPPETPTVVTDHRMILSISKDTSTLYDQIRYSGSPASFAWVLPISGEVTIGISADVVFGALDTMTQTQILAPPLNCPQRPDNCPSPQAASDGAGASDAGASVNVIKKEVVGPYETVQLQASDPGALRRWLSDNGFNVPPDVAPVVDTYVAEKFNFLALKLVPGKGTQDMRPVRVSTKGANVALPLRMVAAGTGPVVGISLWVVGEGRYEPQNFASFLIQTDEIVWDWTASKSNYTELRAQKSAAGGGRVWEIESSIELQRLQLEGIVRQGTWDGRGPYPTTEEERAALDYLEVKDDQGNVTKTALQARDEDLATLLNGIGAPRVTRMRADLQHAALDTDLLMSASKDQAVASNVRQLTREANQPLCPVWNGCEPTGQAPRDEAAARSRANAGDGETFACGTTPKPASSKTWIGVGFAALGLAELARRTRSRRRR
ncbi:MAG: DUF2330 domain-containing protein [Labilithrix sp.]|nr:DUF2330 domain-containing protein [Labilithrix sp.]